MSALTRRADAMLFPEWEISGKRKEAIIQAKSLEPGDVFLYYGYDATIITVDRRPGTKTTKLNCLGPRGESGFRAGFTLYVENRWLIGIVRFNGERE